MVKLKHETMRSCSISVRGKICQVDAAGCVELPDDLAMMVLRGAKWTQIGASNVPLPSSRDPDIPEEKPVQDMTRTEMIKLATELGIEVTSSMSKLKLAAAIREAKKE